MKPQAQAATPSPKEGQSPFFSVIVPVYNVAPYLEECLDSVLAQTFPDWECLCTDDGSKDGSDLILDAYARRDPRFRIVHQLNAGVSAARNRALDRLRGQWVGFLDGDDVIAFDLFRQVKTGTRDVSAIHFALTRNRDELGKSVRQSRMRVVGRQAIHAWMTETYPVLRKGAACSLFIKKEQAASSRFIPGMRLGEDCFFLFDVLLRVESLEEIDLVGYWYRDRAGSAMKSHTAQDGILFIDASIYRWRKNVIFLREKVRERAAEALTLQVCWCIIVWGQECAWGDSRSTKQAVFEALEAFREAGIYRSKVLKRTFRLAFMFCHFLRSMWFVQIPTMTTLCRWIGNMWKFRATKEQ